MGEKSLIPLIESVDIINKKTDQELNIQKRVETKEIGLFGEGALGRARVIAEKMAEDGTRIEETQDDDGLGVEPGE